MMSVPDVLSKHADDCLELQQHTPAAVDALVSFVYSKNYYTEDIHERFSIVSALLFHIHVYCIAEFCQVPGLKALALDKFVRLARTEWESPSFGQAIEIVYGNISEQDRNMRVAMIQISVDNIDNLICDNPAFTKALKTTAPFGSDLSLALTRRLLETNDRLQDAQEGRLAEAPTNAYICGQCPYANITPDAPREEFRFCRRCGRSDHLRRGRPTHVPQIVRSLKGTECGHKAYVVHEAIMFLREGAEAFGHCTICGMDQQWIVE